MHLLEYVAVIKVRTAKMVHVRREIMSTFEINTANHNENTDLQRNSILESIQSYLIKEISQN